MKKIVILGAIAVLWLVEIVIWPVRAADGFPSEQLPPNTTCVERGSGWYCAQMSGNAGSAGAVGIKAVGKKYCSGRDKCLFISRDFFPGLKKPGIAIEGVPGLRFVSDGGRYSQHARLVETKNKPLSESAWYLATTSSQVYDIVYTYAFGHRILESYSTNNRELAQLFELGEHRKAGYTKACFTEMPGLDPGVYDDNCLFVKYK